MWMCKEQEQEQEQGHYLERKVSFSRQEKGHILVRNEGNLYNKVQGCAISRQEQRHY
jgi:hypothetical protein